MPELIHNVFDRTLAEIDKVLDKKMSGDPKRNYVGMSSIGDECQRKLWYTYRLASANNIKANGCRAIEDGFAQEAVMANRLRLLPYIELHTTDPETGGQIAFSFLDGHFLGHADGVIKGIIESQNKWHVWEHKSVNQEKFDKLKKLRTELGEKKALKEWDFVYWAQAQCYMHASGLDRHYLTVSTPGGRDYISVRTEKQLGAIDAILGKAHGVIHGPLPERVSKNREFYLCKWCNHSPVCWDSSEPLKNCGTCGSRGILPEGKFSCLIKMDGPLKNMEPCKDYTLLHEFGIESVLIDAFKAEKIDDIWG